MPRLLPSLTPASHRLAWFYVIATVGVISMLAALIAVSTSRAQAATGPIAAYGFSESSGTTTADQSGNNIIGSLVGATWTSAGKFGNALSFNGSSSYVDLGRPSVL